MPLGWITTVGIGATLAAVMALAALAAPWL